MSTHQLRGASARSLATTLEAVDGLSGGQAEVGRELFGVVGVLDGAPALRRVLTDPSTEGAAKEQLAGSVLGGKVSDATLTVVKAAVSGRWSAGRDLTDALETAGVAALVSASDGSALETELFELGHVVASDDELRSIVNDRTVPADRKATLLASIFEGKVGDSTLVLGQQAAAGRTGSFEKVLGSFGDLIASRRDRVLAHVRVAYEIDADEKQRLAAALSAKYGRDVHLNIVVDPSVVGGIAVSVGSDVVDGTMSTRLEAARRQLAG